LSIESREIGGDGVWGGGKVGGLGVEEVRERRDLNSFRPIKIIY